MRTVEMKNPIILWLLGVAGVLTAIWMGNHVGRLGYLVGFPAGAAVMLAILAVTSLGAMYVQGFLFRGIPGFPVCRNGHCRGGPLCDPGDYIIVWHDDGNVRAFRCRCGMAYQKLGRRFVELAADGSVKPYLIWSRWKGWCADRPQEVGAEGRTFDGYES